ncbi:hypothetical protein BDR06DRAFT_957884, partial [Suillus hirtellus]
NQCSPLPPPHITGAHHHQVFVSHYSTKTLIRVSLFVPITLLATEPFKNCQNLCTLSLSCQAIPIQTSAHSFSYSFALYLPYLLGHDNSLFGLHFSHLILA